MVTSLVRGILLFALLLTLGLPAWAQDAKGVGVVTALTGKADLKRPQAPQVPLKLRDDLFVRDVVDTQKESLARILLMGKSTVTVRELSRFEIREEVRPDGSQRALINLAAGKIRVMVARRLMKPGDEVQIRTPNALASVRGTDGIFEVTTLPDGRPQTVITGVSGEFQVTLPTTPPFITRGMEFLDGPAYAGGAPRLDSPAVALAELASDAGTGIRVAQLPGLSVTTGLQAQITGFAGAQALAQALLTQGQLNQAVQTFHINIGATGASQPPPAATDKVAAVGLSNAQSASLTSGAQPGLTGGAGAQGLGGGGAVYKPPITPLTTTTSTALVQATTTPTTSGLIGWVVSGMHSDEHFVVNTAQSYLNWAGNVSQQASKQIKILSYDLNPSALNYLNTAKSGQNWAITNVTSAEFQTMSVAQINQFNVLYVPSSGSFSSAGGLLNNSGLNGALSNGKTGLVSFVDWGDKWWTQNGSVLKNDLQGKVNPVATASPVDSIVVDTSHPANKNLTNANQSNFGQSAHKSFTSVPTGYKAIATTNQAGFNGQAITIVKEK